jgi:hypothetical protein
VGLHPQPGSPRRLQSWGGEGRSAAEDGAGQPFCFAMQSRAGAGSDGDWLHEVILPAAENVCPAPLQARSASGRSPAREGRWRDAVPVSRNSARA